MKTMFANKVIMFLKTLEYRDAINLCYGRQEVQKLQGRVPNAHTWVVFKMVAEIMLLVVKQCIFNQTRGYWLLSNALNVAISIGVCIQN